MPATPPPAAPPAFSEATFDFLEGLAAQNERAWFEAHKADYEAHCRGPALALIRALAPHLERLAPRFRADDRKVGGSLMRVHRDTRFSADKRPYKTNVGVQLRHEGGADVHAPGVYLHLAPEGCFLGIGVWMPEPPVLDGIRRHIVADPGAWTAAVAGSTGWRFDGEHGAGEKLKRAPKGYDPDHPLIEVLKQRSHLGTVDLRRAELFGPGAADRVAGYLEQGLPYLRWLTAACGAPF
jgi:uncharacterized protein (TIGR02453 family)